MEEVVAKIEELTIARNKRARYDYHIGDVWEAGIKLKGIEVKALRDGNISLSESWVRVSGYIVTLVGCTINPAKVNPWDKYKPLRDRILLLKKDQIRKLSRSIKRGSTVIPLRLYFNKDGLVKLEIATGKGKKLHDKRKTIQDREHKRYGY